MKGFDAKSIKTTLLGKLVNARMRRNTAFTCLFPKIEYADNSEGADGAGKEFADHLKQLAQLW